MALVSGGARSRSRSICGRGWAPEPGEPFELVEHADAMERLASLLGRAAIPAASWERCRKDFPDDGGWRWVLEHENRDEPVTDPALRAFLDERWALVEKVFYGHGVLKPFLREKGGPAAVRPVEAWEWSCIGLHRLWAAWARPEQGLRADLTPAELSFDGAEEPAEGAEREYDLYFALQYLLAFAVAHAGTNGFAGVDDERLPAWKHTIEACLAFCRLGSSTDAGEVFDRLARSGLALRRGRWVDVLVASDRRETIRTSTFCGGVRQLLDRQPR